MTEEFFLDEVMSFYFLRREITIYSTVMNPSKNKIISHFWKIEQDFGGA